MPSRGCGPRCPRRARSRARRGCSARWGRSRSASGTSRRRARLPGRVQRRLDVPRAARGARPPARAPSFVPQPRPGDRRVRQVVEEARGGRARAADEGGVCRRRAERFAGGPRRRAARDARLDHGPESALAWLTSRSSPESWVSQSSGGKRSRSGLRTRTTRPGAASCWGTSRRSPRTVARSTPRSRSSVTQRGCAAGRRTAPPRRLPGSCAATRGAAWTARRSGRRPTPRSSRGRAT